MNSILSARDLTMVRDGKQILDIGELNVDQGEVVAVVGPNGAGKSSLLLTLALLEKATSGTIRLFGEIAGNGNLLALRRRIALVFQDALLLDTTVKRNVTVPMRIRGIPPQEANTRADKWLNQFGIAELSSRRARHLSGGEAQRTSLARAFALEPEILFLDEPFSALDYPTRKSLLLELGQILKQMRLTTVFVTHDYTEIPYFSENVAVLYNGRIIRRGSVREIFGDEILERKICVPWDM
ncbi:ABC transporter related [Syntrophobacter sp. SbD1]|nr:ABC transporter related [Syntrophobacter sp. SbD1]